MKMRYRIVAAAVVFVILVIALFDQANELLEAAQPALNPGDK